MRPRLRVAKTQLDSGLTRAMCRYLDYWQTQTRSVESRPLAGMRSRLLHFIHWCDTHGFKRPVEVSQEAMTRYQQHLALMRKENGEPLALTQQNSRLGTLRNFYRWLAACGETTGNPALSLALPKIGPASGARVFTPEEIELILRQPNTLDPIGLRDRAALELHFATGLRRLELVNLRVDDVDLENKTVLIREGQRRQQRFSVSERIIEWNAVYLNKARPQLIWNNIDPGYLYLSREGQGFNEQWVPTMTKRYAARAGVRK